ncbi:MAG TPA: hypothetical protein PKU91_10910, partial [Phycisphaerales bacterium]|nr:hypothetical protein [Phycisphaerales bacterium]
MMRREFMAASIAAAATAAGTRPGPKPAPGDAPGPESQDQATAPTGGGRLKHSVCQWCFSGMPLEQLAGQAASMGIASIELLAPPQWEIIRAHGLVCAVGGLVPSNPIHSGFNRVENQDAIIRDLET